MVGIPNGGKMSRVIRFKAIQAPRQMATIKTTTVKGRRKANETKFMFEEETMLRRSVVTGKLYFVLLPLTQIRERDLISSPASAHESTAPPRTSLQRFR